MPSIGQTYMSSSAANSYQRFAPSSEQVITLERNCSAVLLAAETATVFVSFDDSAASGTNGFPILAGAQPVLIPLGYHANANHTIRFFSSAGTAHILQLI